MALGLIDLALILTSNHLPLRGAVAVLGLLVGWGWVSTGLFAWARDPENRVGMLMAITGFAWLISLVGVSDIPLLFTFGQVFGSLFFVTALHMLLSAPDGRLHSTFERRLDRDRLRAHAARAPALPVRGPANRLRLRRLP